MLAANVRYGLERGVPLAEIAELLWLSVEDAKMLRAWTEKSLGPITPRARRPARFRPMRAR